MPGEVRRLTRGEVVNLDVFPLPTSGKIRLAPDNMNAYLLDCVEINGADYARIDDFYKRMGALHPFRFESQTHRLVCGFGAAKFITLAPNLGSVQLTLHVFSCEPE